MATITPLNPGGDCLSGSVFVAFSDPLTRGSTTVMSDVHISTGPPTLYTRNKEPGTTKVSV